MFRFQKKYIAGEKLKKGDPIIIRDGKAYKIKAVKNKKIKRHDPAHIRCGGDGCPVLLAERLSPYGDESGPACMGGFL